ncbi:hypothetical protein ACFZBM_31510 [Streptomyces lavendulae]|uniref:hypothetical protein n=1 Tax=Streptomyces lavendulae TaxID=1914 RepID=UPI0036E98F45
MRTDPVCKGVPSGSAGAPRSRNRAEGATGRGAIILSQDIQLLEQALAHTGHTTTSADAGPARSWDLATATGQDRTGAPHAVEAVLHTRYGNYPDAVLPGTGMFGPARSVPADAPASDRLAACFGRTV